MLYHNEWMAIIQFYYNELVLLFMHYVIMHYVIIHYVIIQEVSESLIENIPELLRTLPCPVPFSFGDRPRPQDEVNFGVLVMGMSWILDVIF